MKTRLLLLALCLLLGCPTPALLAKDKRSPRMDSDNLQNAYLRVTNFTRDTVHLYALSIWGGWRWINTLPPGASHQGAATTGQKFVVTRARGNDVVREFTTKDTNTAITLGRDPGYGGGQNGGYDDKVRFRNNTSNTVLLYEVTRWGDWDWRAEISKRNSFAARVSPGQTWVATDRKGRVLTQARIRPGMQTVEIE